MEAAKHLADRIADHNWRDGRNIRIVGPISSPLVSVTSVANVPSFGARYQVERELGRGGMATVYLCTDMKFGRQVAIKLLHPDLAAAVGAERFHREIKIATGLTHPNILPGYDSGESNGSLYYVMPFVQGESLRDRIAREKQLPVDETVRIITEVANALHHAHQNGIIHRDIKPENILLESGVAVVADFGIARAITNASDVEALTQTGVSIGTPTYMSPEQAVGEKGVDGRSDQYSLACVMYEMLAGHPPFQASTLQGLIMKHVGEPVPLVTTVRPSVPDELEDVVLRALEKVPADRFATIGDFAQALNSVVSQTGTWARRTPTGMRTAQLRATRRHAAVAPAASRGRRTAIIAAAASALLLSAAAGTWLVADRKDASGAASVDLGLRHVAVTYFEDHSRDGTLRDVADGLTDALIDRLSAAQPVIKVQSRNAILPYRGATVSADSIGRALDVGTLVQGYVESTNRGGRVAVSVVDAASRGVIDRRVFDFDSTNTLLVVDSVAQQVALFLRARIGEEVALRELRSSTRSTEAWTLAARAERLMSNADSLAARAESAPALKTLAAADSLLTLAAAADPRWAEPLASRAAIAHARALVSRSDPTQLPAIVDSGIALASRALVIDARNADALEWRGKLRFFAVTLRLNADPAAHQRQLEEAEQDLKLATELNPLQAGAWDELSALYYRKADLGLVISAARRAYEADGYLRSSRTILSRLFTATYNQELWIEAAAWMNELKRRFPNDVYWVHARLYMYRGSSAKVDIDSAWVYLEDYVRLSSARTQALNRKKGEMHVAAAIANAARQDSARRTLLADSARAVLLRARANSASIDPVRELAAIEAGVRVLLGDKDIAVERLREYITVNPDHRQGFASRTGWWWRDLQNYPPFQALIRGQ
jgi:TolB-like protein